MTLSANDYLFEVGQPDKNLFIVSYGQVDLFWSSTDASGENNTLLMKRVCLGQSVFSPLSFIQSMNKFKTVSARAVSKVEVLKISFKSLEKSLKSRPECLARVRLWPDPKYRWIPPITVEEVSCNPFTNSRQQYPRNGSFLLQQQHFCQTLLRSSGDAWESTRRLLSSWRSLSSTMPLVQSILRNYLAGLYISKSRHEQGTTHLFTWA